MRRLHLISILLLSLIYEPALLEELKVAIVGAGIGGTSAAYFLSQEIRNVKITRYLRVIKWEEDSRLTKSEEEVMKPEAQSFTILTR